MYKYEEIYNFISAAIKSRTLVYGDKIQSLRSTASQFSCAVSVVMQAYQELECNGYIKSVEKSGYYVQNIQKENIPTPQNYSHSLIPLNSKSNNLTEKIIDMSNNKNIIPFGAAIPDPSILSTKVSTSIIKTLKNNPDCISQYTPAKGSINLRSELVRYMLNKGVITDLEDIVITNGCAEALYLAIKSCNKEGDTIVLETPVFFSLITILEKLKMDIIEIPTKPETGIDLDILEEITKNKNINTVIFSPTFQNPLCSVMPEKNKKRLYQIAINNNLTLIEDDIYGDCSFENKVFKPVKSIDIENRIIYCSSFSKTLSPGLRIGWAIPGKALERFSNLKQISSLGGALLTQESIANYLSTGGYKLHLKQFSKKINKQTMTIKQLIEDNFPKQIKISNPTGGYFLWIEFNENFDSYKLFNEAYKYNIGIVPGPVFSGSNMYKNCIRISCGIPVTEEIRNGIIKLGKIIRSL